MAIKEVTLKENCPGCTLEGIKDNKLRAFPGSFNGMYCLRPGTQDKGHVYADTGDLRVEMEKAAKAQLQTQAKKEAPPEPGEAVSVFEPKSFDLTDMDVARLTDLLQQPITDAATLIGACYSMQIEVAAKRRDAMKEQAASMGTDAPVPQKSDGQLLLKLYIPWNPGKGLIEKAVFNAITLRDVIQGMLEFVMSSTFPWEIQSDGLIDSVDDPNLDGFWVVICVPEIYVGALVDKAEEYKMSPTLYMQAYLFDMMKMEQFV